jgi:hypothetical protein
MGSLQGHSGLCTLPLWGHKICPLWALTSLHPDVLASFHNLCFPIPHRMPVTLILCRFPTKHTLTLFPSLFPRTVEPPLFRAILNSGSCLLLVHLLVVRAQLFHSVSQWANATCFHTGYLAWLVWPQRWRWYVPLKCWLTFSGLHGIIFQKIEPPPVTTSNPT